MNSTPAPVELGKQAAARLDLTNCSRVVMTSDIHLSASESARTRVFAEWLDSLGANHPPDALIVLGDLFDYWIGDDAVDALSHTAHVNALRTLADRGVALYVVHGNRDFLLGSQFANAVGGQLLGEITTVDLACGSAVICHGDELCTDDVDHQTFRTQSRHSDWQTEFLAQSIDARKALAKQARQMSKDAKSTLSMAIMDVHADAVFKTLNDREQRVMIHGHTHRPRIHLDEHRRRVVLGDWLSSPSHVTVTAKGLRLEAGDRRLGGQLPAWH